MEMCAMKQIECANVGEFLDNNNNSNIYWVFNNIPNIILSTLHVFV